MDNFGIVRKKRISSFIFIGLKKLHWYWGSSSIGTKKNTKSKKTFLSSLCSSYSESSSSQADPTFSDTHTRPFC